MTPWKQILRVSFNSTRIIFNRKNVMPNKTGFIKNTSSYLLALGVGAVASENQVKLEVPDASKLSTEYLIKSASTLAVEQANSLISFIAIGLDRAEKQYAEGIFALVLLMEYKLQVLGYKSEEDRIWELILEARSLVNNARQKKKDLELMMISAVNMVNSAAEIAYLIGEDLSGGNAGDRLNKVETFLKHSKHESERAEQRLREIEAKTIETETKHAEERARKEELKQEEELQKAQKLEDEKNEKESKANEQEESDDSVKDIEIVDERTQSDSNKNEEFVT